jgi:MFS family permease
MATSAGHLAIQLVMTFLIGAGTACLLAGTNLMGQVGAPMALRGRMAGLGQIAFLGGGGLSGIAAALLSARIGLGGAFALLGAIGLVLGLGELLLQGRLRLVPPLSLKSDESREEAR